MFKRFVFLLFTISSFHPSHHLFLRSHSKLTSISVFQFQFYFHWILCLTSVFIYFFSRNSQRTQTQNRLKSALGVRCVTFLRKKSAGGGIFLSNDVTILNYFEQHPDIVIGFILISFKYTMKGNRWIRGGVGTDN